MLDWYSRYVLAWGLSDTLAIDFVHGCAQRALDRAAPAIWNSDQGSHFTSPQYTDLLLGAGVQISMDGRGHARDTRSVFVERLWRTVKYEVVYLTEYATPRDARCGLGRSFQFYNGERPHTCTCAQVQVSSARLSDAGHGLLRLKPLSRQAAHLWSRYLHRLKIVYRFGKPSF